MFLVLGIWGSVVFAFARVKRSRIVITKAKTGGNTDKWLHQCDWSEPFN